MEGEMKVAVTGHRVEKLTDGQMESVIGWFESLVPYLRDSLGMKVAISGMATGVDTWWAHAAENHGVDLWSYVPFWGQGKDWESGRREEWERLLVGVAKEVRVFGYSEPYDVGLFHKRNDGMVADADMMIAVLKSGEEKSGTGSCFAKWQLTGKPWIRYDPSNGEMTQKP